MSLEQAVALTLGIGIGLKVDDADNNDDKQDNEDDNEEDNEEGMVLMSDLEEGVEDTDTLDDRSEILAPREARPTIRLAFHNFWSSFSPKNNHFIRLLRRQWEDREIIIDDQDPDILFYSCFHRGKARVNFRKQYPRALVIFYTGENKRPDFDRCHLALSFDWTDNPRNYRLPLYFMRKDRILLDLQARGLPSLGQQILDQKKGFCCFLVSNGGGDYRNKVFHRLSKYKKVDSGGRYLNNIGRRVGKDEMYDWIRGYKFMICFENSEYPGYTTEKLPNTYIAGTVGVYWGNPMVSRDFNTKAFVNYYSAGSTKALIKRLIELDSDDEKYLAMLREPLFPDNLLSDTLKDSSVAEFIQKGLENKKVLVQSAKRAGQERKKQKAKAKKVKAKAKKVKAKAKEKAKKKAQKRKLRE